MADIKYPLDLPLGPGEDEEGELVRQPFPLPQTDYLVS